MKTTILLIAALSLACAEQEIKYNILFKETDHMSGSAKLAMSFVSVDECLSTEQVKQLLCEEIDKEKLSEHNILDLRVYYKLSEYNRAMDAFLLAEPYKIRHLIALYYWEGKKGSTARSDLFIDMDKNCKSIPVKKQKVSFDHVSSCKAQ